MSRIYEAVKKYIDDVSDELQHGGCESLDRREPDTVVVLAAGDSFNAKRPSARVAAPVEKVRPERSSGLEGTPVEAVDIDRFSRVPLVTDPRGPAADRFRFLRLRLLEFQGKADRRRILVTSALPQEGKSTVALNVATVLAEGGKRAVLLVDADLHHSTTSSLLGLDGHLGLAECLQAGLRPKSAIVRLEPLGCCFMPSGKAAGNPTELLQSAALPALLEQVSFPFDWIVIDSPPVGVLTDSLALRKAADGTLLVVKAGKTRCDAVEEALTLLGREHIIGIVLNAVEGVEQLYSKYSKYYRRKD
jgi:capsular exopolysaccharide synthesis family protein